MKSFQKRFDFREAVGIFNIDVQNVLLLFFFYITSLAAANKPLQTHCCSVSKQMNNNKYLGSSLFGDVFHDTQG